METTLTDDLYDPGCVFSLAWLPAGKVFKLDSLPNEDMILALAGQFKQLSHEPEKFR